MARHDSLSTTKSLERERDEGFLPTVGEAKSAVQSFFDDGGGGGGSQTPSTPVPAPAQAPAIAAVSNLAGVVGAAKVVQGAQPAASTASNILGQAASGVGNLLDGGDASSTQPAKKEDAPALVPTFASQQQPVGDIGVQNFDWVDEGGHDPTEGFSDYDMLTLVASLEDCKKQCVVGIIGCKERCGSPSSLEREQSLLYAASLEQGSIALERESGFLGDAKAAVQSLFGGGAAAPALAFANAAATAPNPATASGSSNPAAKECHVMGYSLGKQMCWLYHNVYQLSYKPSDSGVTYYTKHKKDDPWSVKWNKHVAPDCLGPEVLEDGGKFKGDAMACKLKAIENMKANYAVWGGEKAKNVCKLCRISQEVRTSYVDSPGAVTFSKKDVKPTPTPSLNQLTTAPPSTSSGATEVCKGQNCTHGAHHRNQWYEETTPAKSKLNFFTEEDNPELHKTCCDSSPFCCSGTCQSTQAMCKGDFQKEEKLNPFEDEEEESEGPAKKESSEEETKREVKDEGNDWVQTRYNKAIFDIQNKAALQSEKPKMKDKPSKKKEDLERQFERIPGQSKQQLEEAKARSVAELLFAAQADGALQAARAFEKEVSHSGQISP